LIDLLCLTQLSAIFSYIMTTSFFWWKKPEYPERTTDHWQTSGKFYHFFVIFVTYKVEGEYKEVYKG